MGREGELGFGLIEFRCLLPVYKCSQPGEASGILGVIGIALRCSIHGRMDCGLLLLEQWLDCVAKDSKVFQLAGDG